MAATADHQTVPSALNHWHPVILSAELGDKPAGVKMLGQQLVLFRTSNGVAALDDRCPHRGARLSTGTVAGDCVVCPYHLWRFDGHGAGHSPTNPRMQPFTTAFDAVEHCGFVWVKPKGADGRLPEIDDQGLYFSGRFAGVINAPFPLVVDNFTEIEHSPTNHFLFAFDDQGIMTVEPKVEVFDDRIHVVYAGPQRPAPWWTLLRLVGLKAGLHHVIDFSVHFAPIHWTYDYFWEDPTSGRRLPQRVREFAFITPADENTTLVFILFFTSMKLFAPINPIVSLVRWLFRTTVQREFLLDKRICENVAGMDPRTNLEGWQLGKFDHVLRTTRRLTADVYCRGASLTSSR